MYLRARYYDPGTGQFVSVDRLRDVTGTLYGYTDGNPVMFVDPLGLWGWNLANWTGDEWDTISTFASVGAWALGATGVGGPAATALGGIAVGASVAAAYTHAQDGEYAAAARSGVGAVLGAAAPLGNAMRAGVRFKAASAGELTRTTGGAVRAAGDRISLVGDAWSAGQMGANSVSVGAAC